MTKMINSSKQIAQREISSSSNRGFTLIEVAVAVAILGVALVSLLGLHTRMMNTYINEKNRFRAALSLQYVSSILETQAQPPDVGSTSEAFDKTLSDLGFFDTDSSDQKEQFGFEGWEFEQNVEAIGLPTDREELAEDAIRKISMRVVWGPSQDEQYTLVYFVASPLEIPNAPGLAGNAASGAGAAQ